MEESTARIYCQASYTHQWANLFVANILRFLVMRVVSTFFFLRLYHNSCLGSKQQNTKNRNFLHCVFCSGSFDYALSSFFFLCFHFQCALSCRFFVASRLQSIVVGFFPAKEEKQAKYEPIRLPFWFYYKYSTRMVCVLRQSAFGFRSTNRTRECE